VGSGGDLPVLRRHQTHPSRDPLSRHPPRRFSATHQDWRGRCSLASGRMPGCVGANGCGAFAMIEDDGPIVPIAIPLDANGAPCEPHRCHCGHTAHFGYRDPSGTIVWYCSEHRLRQWSADACTQAEQVSRVADKPAVATLSASADFQPFEHLLPLRQAGAVWLRRGAAQRPDWHLVLRRAPAARSLAHDGMKFGLGATVHWRPSPFVHRA
jgi:hypothetical protein